MPTYPSKDKRCIHFVALCAFFLLPLPAHAGLHLTGRATVIDGDTMEIHGNRIRLFGIDAPEGRQTCTRNGKDYRCGQEAAVALDDLIANQTVRCDRRDTDRYQRTVAVCYLGTTDINGWMVQHGYALAYRHFSTDYICDESAARKARRGVWAGEFIEPWTYRKMNRR